MPTGKMANKVRKAVKPLTKRTEPQEEEAFYQT